MALTNKLSAIGDAIREKTGKSELLTLDAMPGEIASIETGGGSSIEVEPVVISGDGRYACVGAIASKYIELFGDTVSTKDISDAYDMFYLNSCEKIPFDINIADNVSACSLAYIFASCKNLKELPNIKGNGKILETNHMFSNCYNLREIPNDYFDMLNLNDWATSTNGNKYPANNMFLQCYSLRKLPLQWFEKMSPVSNYNKTYLYGGFRNCYNLDELTNLPIPYTATYTSNMFYTTFENCYCLKEMTFELDENDSPLVKQWKSQTIDLSLRIGYANTSDYHNYILKYNSGRTSDKNAFTDERYQALKNDPDYFTTYDSYARYNHDSAVNTINTLPDTSAYLATAGGTNTIKFKGAAGLSTDGGAINTMTEEEIAVATAKGWTVSMI